MVEGYSKTSSVCLDLLCPPSDLNSIVQDVASDGASLIIDISAMPKRVFLFLVKRALALPQVRDVVVCYTRAERYKEGVLTSSAQPPAALPGFAREGLIGNNGSGVIVSVGYMAFNLGDYLEQANGTQLKFLFPFPPGSPAFRRNWNLLHRLAPDLSLETEIRRIHAMDLFAAFDWLRGELSSSRLPIDMIPLGPKPHALAMALAQQTRPDDSEVLYSHTIPSTHLVLRGPPMATLILFVIVSDEIM